MKQRKRRHHRVPVALLGRFTEDRTDDGVLHVLDTHSGAWRESTPTRECFERDYYTVDAPGLAPDEVEDILADHLESPAGPALKDLAAAQRKPTRTERNAIVLLLAMQLVRVEPFRRRLADLDSLAAKKIMLEATTRDEFQRFVQERGMDLDDADRRSLRRAIVEGTIKFGFSGTTRAVQHMLMGFDKLLPLLDERWWYVATVVIGAPDLICSEYPAKLVFPDSTNGELLVIPPAEHLPEAEVLMPLSPRQVLIGSTWRRPLVPFLVPRMVDAFNRAIAAEARWVYAREPVALGVAVAR